MLPNLRGMLLSSIVLVISALHEWVERRVKGQAKGGAARVHLSTLCITGSPQLPCGHQSPLSKLFFQPHAEGPQQWGKSVRFTKLCNPNYG